ncbi:hypothetical protein [Ketogulonicigenium vulgare]|uniref:hypothetical protein n=1 Tax=Ketogulonicigenium vulgare TaxID=92945 RepID=UPI0023589A4E|nr:hypothetical protein [Ketogulonicigenium vulgare]
MRRHLTQFMICFALIAAAMLVALTPAVARGVAAAPCAATQICYMPGTAPVKVALPDQCPACLPLRAFENVMPPRAAQVAVQSADMPQPRGLTAGGQWRPPRGVI